LDTHESHSLRERIAQALSATASRLESAVPIDELAVFLTLCHEVCNSLGNDDLRGMHFVADAATASQLHELDGLVEHASKCMVIGDVPDRWSAFVNVHAESLDGRMQQRDRILVVLSPQHALALLGSQEDGGDRFDGIWTADRATVAHIMVALLGAESAPQAPEDAVAPEAEFANSALVYRLMNLQANTLATRNRAYAMDKHDLISVLEILKAISAKRRAHDILFVFVEQIARVVEMNRCSIVRIWGSGRYGQVLASHEDASVQDRSIDLDKYPELNRAVLQRKKIVINDVASDPITAEFASALQGANIDALAVIPIVLYDENVGSLVLRAARKGTGFTLREISFFEIVAEAASNALERAHLFESIQLANKRLEHLATTDGLTGLYNHRYFRERLDGELERAFRYRLPLSCLIFDVDNFKSLNDTYGHLLGDSVLKELAQHAQGHIRKSDLIARYGGEEFVVILPQTDSDGAATEAERLRQEIERHTFQGVPAERRVTVSIGAATLLHDTMMNGDDLLHAADKALYNAKNNGKNRIEVYTG
jgi:two-component system cell cycle response regulator